MQTISTGCDSNLLQVGGGEVGQLVVGEVLDGLEIFGFVLCNSVSWGSVVTECGKYCLFHGGGVEVPS